MPEPYIHPIRVEFRDTDAAGIAHFSVFFVWMEQAEHAALRHVGLSVMNCDTPDGLSWPRVAAHCDYKLPVRFEQTLNVLVDISKLSARSVTYRFRFDSRGSRIATGQLTAVCCQEDRSGNWGSVPIPDAVVDQLRPLIVDDQNESRA